MEFKQAVIRIKTGEGEKRYILIPDQANSFDELYLDFKQERVSNGTRYSIFLHPKQDLRVLELKLGFGVGECTHFLANGFQSWSESQLLTTDASVPALKSLARPAMQYYGDTHIPGIARGKGHLHSWTYTYFREPTGKTTLCGSLSEQSGFTLFALNKSKGQISVHKDLSGLDLSHSFPGIDIWVGTGEEAGLFDQYFARLKENAENWRVPDTSMQGSLNWTSWYRYFNRVTAKDVLENVASIQKSGLPFRYVQIDDGWQTAVGDWRSVKSTFPDGMQALATAIRDQGFQPGLWLAPFVAAAKSDLVRRHPEWLLKKASGKPLRAGWNPYWGGWYYALDFYNQAVQDHLSGVFHIILEQWGYEMLKLDFLFAACLIPPAGKTRGQVMHDVMRFLRQQIGDKVLLACGVPLGSAFGTADICRIGGDVHVKWEHRMLQWLRHRERVSTLASLRSTLGRWQLNKRAFLSDPDVFILRDAQQGLSPVQKHTLLTINTLLGGLLFTSDAVGDYTDKQLTELKSVMQWQGAIVQHVEHLDIDLYQILFSKDQASYVAYCNLNNKAVQAESKEQKNGRIELRPFETIILSV